MTKYSGQKLKKEIGLHNLCTRAWKEGKALDELLGQSIDDGVNRTIKGTDGGTWTYIRRAT